MNKIRFLSDFRNLNRQLERKPYPMPKIRDMLLSLQVFQYAMTRELNMGCYHIFLGKEAGRLCTIILAWGSTSISAYQ